MARDRQTPDQTINKVAFLSHWAAHSITDRSDELCRIVVADAVRRAMSRRPSGPAHRDWLLSRR